jgi:hypothetical protein
MPTVAVNPPKTPVTKGSNGMATATLPNICKMPPPPPPFCPTPLPNIGMSGKNPQKYTSTVKIEGQFVAIQGASFDSVGDIASKATGGGVVSNNAEGPTKFIALGALDTKFEGQDVQFLGDQMLNNCGPAGSPANSATMAGVLQVPNVVFSPTAEKEIRCAILACEKADAKGAPYPAGSCRATGKKKHACVHAKLKGKEPAIFSEAPFAMTKPPQMAMSGSNPGTPTNLFEARRLAKPVLGKLLTVAQAVKAGNPVLASIRIPDTLIKDAAGNLKIIDAKFPCSGDKKWGPGQLKSYKKIVGRKGKVVPVSPADVKAEECT